MGAKKGGVFGQYLTGYILVVVVDMSYTVSVISAQLSMADTPLFEPNCFRFAVTIIMSLALLIIFCQSWRIEAQHIHYIIIIGLCDYIYSTCYYVAAVFMPVGDLEGIFVSMWIICTTMVDLFRQRVDIKSIISAIVASLGIFLLTQPWRKHTYAVDVLSQAPCEMMFPHVTNASNIIPNQINNLFSVINATDQTNISYVPTDPYSTAQTTKNDPMGPYMNIETTHNALILGYILVIVAAISATISSNLAQNLMSTYPVATLSLWIAILEGAISVILTCAFYKSPGYGGWTLPSATYCLIFTIIYTIFAAVMDISSYYTYNFLPVSQVAICLSFTVVILYVCQRTVLYNDGNANIFEAFGVLCTLCGAMLCPMFSLLGKKSKYDELE